MCVNKKYLEDVVKRDKKGKSHAMLCNVIRNGDPMMYNVISNDDPTTCNVIRCDDPTTCNYVISTP